jgi:glycosyltransferase involved in cell wall biosynthesis
MKVSIITAVLNRVETIEYCIKSVLSQRYKDIEHIIIDGGSTDGTVDVIKKYKKEISYWVSEIDKGMYDGMNKGIRKADGHIVGILNSDDLYADDKVISTVVDEFARSEVDSVFGDLVYVKGDNLKKIVRKYRSARFDPVKMAYGWMPAHPTFFAKRVAYERYGLFKTDYEISADYELVARFLWKNRISYRYIPKVLVKMRTGGASTRNWKSNWILNKEILRACSENGISTNIFKIYSKYPAKILELFNRTK